MDKKLIELRRELTTKAFADLLLQQQPIYWHAPSKLWVVTRHSMAEDVYKHPALSNDRAQYFASRMPEIDYETIKGFFSVITKTMMLTDLPQHTPMRRICFEALTAQVRQRVLQQLEQESLRLIESFKAERNVDIVKRYIEKASCFSLATLFSVPEDFRDKFYYCGNYMTQFFGGFAKYDKASGVHVSECAQILRAYFEQALAERRAEPRDDILTLLLHKQASYQLTDDELVAQCIILLVAGQVTVSDQFANILYQLLQQDLWQQLDVKDESTLSAYIEELTRLEPAVFSNDRVVKEDVIIAGQDLKVGQPVVISHVAANRDPSVFPQQHAIDLENASKKHLGFGHGVHYCLGANMARKIMLLMLQHLKQNFPEMKLQQPECVDAKTMSLAFSGFYSIGVEL